MEKIFCINFQKTHAFLNLLLLFCLSLPPSLSLNLSLFLSSFIRPSFIIIFNPLYFTLFMLNKNIPFSNSQPLLKLTEIVSCRIKDALDINGIEKKVFAFSLPKIDKPLFPIKSEKKTHTIMTICR